MRRATKGSWLWLVTVIGLTVGGQGCDLNPQPLPPNEDLVNGNASSSGAGGGASYSSSDASVPETTGTDASTGTPNAPGPDGGNSATDGGGDAPADSSMSAEAATDGGADAALDADGAGASNSDSASDAAHASDGTTDGTTDGAADGATDATEGGE
jgi:hypothetical protein